MNRHISQKKRHPKKERCRKCLVTGETYPVHKLIRFVLDPAGNITPDVAAKLPGRGGWILAEGEILKRAVKKKIFVRFGHKVLTTKAASHRRKAVDIETLDDEDKDLDHKKMGDDNNPKQQGPKQQVTVDENLPELVGELLRKRCLNYLGLANRAGLLVSGYEKVRKVLQAQKCGALITAEDAAEGGRSKICSGLGNILEKMRVIDMFTRDELGQTLGLPNAVHLALLSGGMTESFLNEFSRYENITMR